MGRYWKGGFVVYSVQYMYSLGTIPHWSWELLPQSEKNVTTFAAYGSFVVLGTVDGMVIMWDFRADKIIHFCVMEGGEIKAVECSSCGKYLFVACGVHVSMFDVEHWLTSGADYGYA